MFIDSQRFKKMLVCDTFEYLTSTIMGKPSKAVLICSPQQLPLVSPAQRIPADLKIIYCHDQTLLYYHNALGNLNTLQISRAYANIQSVSQH